MNKNKILSQNSKNHLMKTKGIFEDIKISADGLIEKIELINENIYTVERGQKKVLNSLEQLASIGEESASGAQEISASSEEQVASNEEVVKAIRNLKEKIDELYQSIEIFKI